jgi:hypothetical protein
MANVSVAEKTIPGLAALLINSDGLADPKRIEQAADNALFGINDGINAIGELLWQSAHGDNELSQEGIAGIGFLLQHLATFSKEVGYIRSQAYFAAYDSRRHRP